jgi:hypothetical protein
MSLPAAVRDERASGETNFEPITVRTDNRY